MRQFGEFVDVAIHAADKTIKLRQDFRDIGGNFSQRARENIEIVIAVHLQLAEFGQRVIKAVRIAGVTAAQRKIVYRPRRWRGMNAAEFVLLLEFRDLILHARLGEIQHVSQTFQFGHSAKHACAIDHQLAHGVHHAVQAFQGNAHGLGLRHGRRLFTH